MKSKTINQYLDELLGKYKFSQYNDEMLYLYNTLTGFKNEFGGKQLISPTGILKELLDKYLLGINPITNYLIGDKFKGPDGMYILAQTSSKKCGLLNMDTGYLWSAPVKVGDISLISSLEFNMIANFSFSEFIKM